MLKYEAICMTGKVRKNNEDNYYINGKHLPMIHGDSPLEKGTIFKGPMIAAVFDGMGGEDRGEAASYLAASTLADYTGEGEEIIKEKRPQGRSGKGEDKAIIEYNLPYEMNDRINQYIKKEKLRFCGSTLAMISIDNNTAICTNVGDSRIYLLREGKLIQISKDHSIGVSGRKRLTQCLGIPKEEFIISPYVKNIPIKKGDIYLLCSDGVTDMLSDDEIEDLMKSGKGLDEMERNILKEGAIDNYTGILLYF